MSSNDSVGGASHTAVAAPHAIDGRRIIAIFKFVKAFLLILTSYGVHKLLDPHLIDEIRVWSAGLTDRVDQRYIERALDWVERLGANRLHLVMTVTIAYTAVVLVEGTGLWLRKRWAEWVTLIATCSLIPVEVYEVFNRPPGRRWTVAVTLLLNLLIAGYLGHLLRVQMQRERAGGDGG